jgi:hypothetical protein
MAQQAGSTGGGAPLIESIHGAHIHGHKTHTHTYYVQRWTHTCSACARACTRSGRSREPTGSGHVVWRWAWRRVGRDRREQKHPCMAPRPVLAALTSLGQQGAGAESKRGLAEARPGPTRASRRGGSAVVVMGVVAVMGVVLLACMSYAALQRATGGEGESAVDDDDDDDDPPSSALASSGHKTRRPPQLSLSMGAGHAARGQARPRPTPAPAPAPAPTPTPTRARPANGTRIEGGFRSRAEKLLRACGAK